MELLLMGIKVSMIQEESFVFYLQSLKFDLTVHVKFRFYPQDKGCG